MCIQKGSFRVMYCEQSTNEEDVSTLDWLFESCRQFYNPVRSSVGYIYKNIFCFICRDTIQLTANNPSCSCVEDFKSSSGYITALFNYKLEPENTAQHEDDRLVDEGPCGCAEMFDPYLVNAHIDLKLPQIKTACSCCYSCIER